MADYIPTRMAIDELMRQLSLQDAVMRLITMYVIYDALLASDLPSCAGDVITDPIDPGNTTGTERAKWFGELQAKGLTVTLLNDGTFTLTL